MQKNSAYCWKGKGNNSKSKGSENPAEEKKEREGDGAEDMGNN